MLECLQNLTLVICLLRFGGLAAQCVRETQSQVTAVELVDEAFRGTVLTTDSLLALMSSRPDTAQEVILACCIEEPQNEYDRSHSLRLDESGFAFWHNHLPAMYFTRPWLLFLRTSPAHALKTILLLIEFATDRWADGYKAFTRSAELPAFKILFDGTEKNFVGDGNVYNWHSYMSDRAVVVESALMALEKWRTDFVIRCWCTSMDW